MEIDVLAFFERIGKIWDRPIGLFSVIITVFFGFYVFLWSIFQTWFGGNILFTLSLYIGLNLAIIITWFLTTKRFFFRFNSQIVLALNVSTDESNIDYRIKKVVKNTIKEIHEQFDRKKIRIHLLPLNYIKNEKKRKRFLELRGSMIDTLIDIKLASGNFENIGKMFITEMNAIAYFDHSKREKQLFFDKVELQGDLNIVNYHKNWEYIYSNDGNDKIKLKENLKETILHYCGIYTIYQDNFELSLEFLSSIFTPEHRQVQKPQIINGKPQFPPIKPENVVAARLATVLANVYLAIGFDNLNRNKQEEALEMFLECEKLGRNKHTYPMFIGIARISFELGNLNKAIEYNNKAKVIMPYGREILMNEAWFAAIANHISRFCLFYNKLIMKGPVKNQNYVDVIEFIRRHRTTYPQASVLFDFMEGYINYVSVDNQIGQSTLINLQNQIQGNPQFSEVSKMIIRVLGNSKPVGAKKKKRKKSKKRRK